MLTERAPLRAATRSLCKANRPVEEAAPKPAPFCICWSRNFRGKTPATMVIRPGDRGNNEPGPASPGGVYGLAAAAISHTVGESANLFLRLGAHLSAVETEDLFIWAALGISYGVW
jgi:hypothetical protein